MLTFRPHHFLCTLGFRGLGYSPAFVDNFKSIVEELNAPSGDSTLIQVVKGSDAICAPCPHRKQQLCHYQAKIQQLDQAHGQALGVSPGDQLTWGEAKDRIAKQITICKFHHICAQCSWRALGVCMQALSELHAKKAS
jgi:hypothetical protein